jgi:hypothetical protein
MRIRERVNHFSAATNFERILNFRLLLFLRFLFLRQVFLFLQDRHHQPNSAREEEKR